MNTIDFNKHDINICIKDTWQKYAGDYSKLRTQNNLNFTSDQWESEANIHKANSSTESPCSVSPVVVN